MDTFVFALFNGVSYGLMLFLLASGFTLIFGMMGVLNIAHASFFMLGAYFAYELTTRLGFAAAVVLAPLMVGLLGALTERYLLRRVRAGGHMAELLLTFGLTYVVMEFVQLVWGRTPVPYAIPAALDFGLFEYGGIRYSAYRVLVPCVTLIVFAGLYFAFRFTRLGLIVQASLSKPKMVSALGHDVDRITTLVFAVGAGLAGFGGALMGNILGTLPTMALQLGSLIFVVVVIGGLGSLSGAMLASLAIGVMQTMVASYPISGVAMATALGFDPEVARAVADLRSLSSASLAPLLPYLFMIAFLLVRPRGLFGTRDV